MARVSKPSIKRLLELQQFLLAFQDIKRMILIPDKEAYEDDVQHSYHLAMTGWFLARYFPELDRDKIIRYSLAHDLVEVYAGDTYLYDEEATKTKDSREAEGFKQLQKAWQDFPDMLQAIQAYKTKSDAEAKFVYALDKIMPTIVTVLDKGRLWQQEKISYQKMKSKKRGKVEVSPEINEYYKQLLKLLDSKPEYFHESK